MAISCGADAVGFVFWPRSPRFIDPYRARAIARALPAFVTTVGVFVNQPAAYVNGVAGLVRLGAVQLHGDETPQDARGLVSPVLKALSGAAAERDADAWNDPVTLLFDAHDRERRGGTGQPADWDVARRIAQRRRLMLAGGLKAENVSEAVSVVRPFGVDVSSGVEQEPGVKDHGRLRAFFEALQSVTR